MPQLQQTFNNCTFRSKVQCCKICINFCNFDFVNCEKKITCFAVAVENMSAESKYILEKAGLRETARVFNKTKKQTARGNEKRRLSASYQDYYRGMNRKDLKALEKLYAFDIYVLQYPNTPFVDFEQS